MSTNTKPMPEDWTLPEGVGPSEKAAYLVLGINLKIRGAGNMRYGIVSEFPVENPGGWVFSMIEMQQGSTFKEAKTALINRINGGSYPAVVTLLNQLSKPQNWEQEL